ncbi:MAG: ROK family protein [Saprospiraceae bacterium]
MSEQVLGIDIGGTGVKAAVVDTENGELLTEKIKYATPKPSYPSEVMKVVNKLIDDHDWRGKPIGCGIPCIIKNNVIHSAANIEKSWLNVNLDDLFEREIGQEATFMNDADAAGFAEITHGQGRNTKGTVLMLTLGTGIGSGLFRDLRLIPNTEFGHLEHKKSIWEHYASNSAREKKDLSWQEWGAELNEYLNHVNLIISPDLIILGGGVSKKYEKYRPYLNLDVPIVPAKMLNNAGIIGAAMNAVNAVLV